jgi:excisionase family DNA binding protein
MASDEILADLERLLVQWRRELAPVAAKAPPVPYVDLTPYADKSDAEVARILGGHGEFFVEHVADERSGRNDARVGGALRCEAGRTSRLNLRCLRRPLPQERWCHDHHAQPPSRQSAAAKAYSGRATAAHMDELRAQLDALTTEVRQGSAATTSALRGLERLEKRAQGKRGDLLRVPDVAKRLGVSPQHVYRLAHQHDLTFVRLGKGLRFREEDLEQWLRSKAVRARRWDRT